MVPADPPGQSVRRARGTKYPRPDRSDRLPRSVPGGATIFIRRWCPLGHDEVCGRLLKP